MNLQFDLTSAAGYKSPSQIARVLTEQWVKENAYCPSCGNDNIIKTENNSPVKDYYCDSCKEEYELKSKKDKFSKKVNDGAYSTMIERIGSDNNPNFFFLTYNSREWTVNDFIIVPKFYVIPGVIERRKPLKEAARCAGWTGCNILFGMIPEQGKLYLIKSTNEVPREDVIRKWNQSEFLKNQSHDSRGWLVDIMYCIGLLPESVFTLDDVYSFEGFLKSRHPQNNFVKDKIRQQLQVLRDKGIVEFISRGVYRKL